MSIRNQIERFGFDEVVIEEAEKIYEKINKRVSRGKKRTLKNIFCVYNAYLNLDRVADIRIIASKMGFYSKTASAFTLFSPINTGYHFKHKRFGIKKYMNLYMSELALSYDQKTQIMYIYRKVNETDISQFKNNHSNQIIAIAFILYYMKNNGIDINNFEHIINRPIGTIEAVVKKVADFDNRG